MRKRELYERHSIPEENHEERTRKDKQKTTHHHTLRDDAEYRKDTVGKSRGDGHMLGYY